ncbi:NAD-dependent DNA ligase LigA [Cyclobacterium amurskyense]|uniref:DNA ligase n=1 Tax=Cyclobacterium amurskyense TaxID=320787 RepID=A0A0H4PKS6_9BACT|nr:NAD-dependent DNA ligase LigA [Cyclobacterium amurskyense]AKP53640.1 DNA ligase [Cyclobacterium amurskyense]
MNKVNKKEAGKLIDELTREINHYNHLYYQEDKSEISDFDFDQLLDKLIQLENEYPDLKKEDSPTQRVGGTITKNFETAEHSVRMLSLGNTYSKEELIAFDERVAKGLEHRNYNYLCELKFDGVAISLVYENGVLTRAVTRGDGYKGDVVTENVKTIRTIPLVIKDQENLPSYFEARGEIFLSKQGFEKINAERLESGESLLANPRNTASGTLKMQDSSVVAKRRLNCYLYQLIADDYGIIEHGESLQLLENWGFNVSPTYKQCQNLDEVLAYIEYWREKRHHLSVETDGVVIKVNDYRQQEELGFTAKIPKWAIAFKYQAESAESTLLSIQYQVGRTGAITPVANLSPVSLAGTTVKRASLHNANEIERLDLHEGDTVNVEKGGEIIPKITGVVLERRISGSKPIVYIKHCPECGTLLERNEGEAKHFCPNDEACPPQVLGRIEHFVSKRAMNIDSLGTERLRALIQQGYVQDLADLYYLPEKKGELLGLEVSDDQYSKNSDGYLYVSLKKALYAISQHLTLKEIDSFIDTHENYSLHEKVSEFINFVKNTGKKAKSNLDSIKKLDALLDKGEFDLVEDFVPVAYILYILTGNENSLAEFTGKTKNKNSVHEIVINDTVDLFGGAMDQINKLKGSTFQEGVIKNMLDGIAQSTSQPFPKVLFGLGIRNIGENTAILLAKHFQNIENLEKASAEELLEINGVGETLVQSIGLFFSKEKNRMIIDKLKAKGLQFQLSEKETQLESTILEGKKILASGRLNHFKRDEIMDFVASHGGTYSKSVSKNLDFIIEGEEMGPSKKEKARKLNIPLISEESFLEMCGKNKEIK